LVGNFREQLGWPGQGGLLGLPSNSFPELIFFFRKQLQLGFSYPYANYLNSYKN
jgi:hypothetical protein